MRAWDADRVHRIGLVIAAVGILLRLFQYLYNRSLFIDESALALNIRYRTLAELFSMPLAGGQSGPPLFIALLRGLVVAFGDSELVLRLPSTIAGIISVVLFARLSRELTSGAGRLLGLTLFCVSFPLIYFAVDAKPYAVDVAACLAMLLLVLPLQFGKLDNRRTILLSAAGVLFALLSQAMVFVIGSVAILLAFTFSWKKDWQSLGRLTLVGAVWAPAILFSVWYSERALGPDGIAYMRDFWQASFLPFPPRSLRELLDYPVTAFNFGFSPIGSVLPGVVMFAVIGVIAKSGASRWRLALIGLPILLTAAASALQRYPFGGTDLLSWSEGRVVLFLAPLVILLIVSGWELLASSTFRLQRRAMAVAGALMVAGNIGLVLSFPFDRQETRRTLAALSQRFREGDLVYVYYGARHSYEYYSKHLAFEPARLFLGGCHRSDPEKYLLEIEQLKGQPRVWLYLSHPFGGEIRYIQKYLDRSATQLEVYDEVGSRAVLYDLRDLKVGAAREFTRTFDDFLEVRPGWECNRGIHTYPFNGWDSPLRVPLGHPSWGRSPPIDRTPAVPPPSRVHPGPAS